MLVKEGVKGARKRGSYGSTAAWERSVREHVSPGSRKTARPFVWFGLVSCWRARPCAWEVCLEGLHAPAGCSAVAPTLFRWPDALPAEVTKRVSADVQSHYRKALLDPARRRHVRLGGPFCVVFCGFVLARPALRMRRAPLDSARLKGGVFGEVERFGLFGWFCIGLRWFWFGFGKLHMT